MKTNNSSVEDINYHPKSTSTVDFSINEKSSIKNDINLEVYQTNIENQYNRCKDSANNSIHRTGEHARFSEVTPSKLPRSNVVADATASR